MNFIISSDEVGPRVVFFENCGYVEIFRDIFIIRCGRQIEYFTTVSVYNADTQRF